MRKVGPAPSHFRRAGTQLRFFKKLLHAALVFGLLGLLPLPAAEKNPNLLREIEQTVKQADTTLDSVDKSLNTNQFNDIQAQLKRYNSLLETARTDAEEYLQAHNKTPHQFKDAEIKLRKQIRRLEDLRPQLPIALRVDLDAAVDSANRLRKKFVGKLFNITPPPPSKTDARNSN